MVCIRYFERIKSRDKIMNYNSQTNTAMPVYDRECEGHLLNAYTYDANRFNNMIMQGFNIKDILESELAPIPIRNWGGFGGYGDVYYLIYEYTVDGITYVRACPQPIPTNRSAANGDKYVRNRLRWIYKVKYSSQNPGVSFLNKGSHRVADMKNGLHVTNIAPIRINRRRNTKTNGAISMFASVFAICFSLIAPIGITAGIIGLLYGLKGRKTDPEEKSSTTGIILSSAGLVLSILGIIGFFIMLTIVF